MDNLHNINTDNTIRRNNHDMPHDEPSDNDNKQRNTIHITKHNRIPTRQMRDMEQNKKTMWNNKREIK
jgi:hypothetical protein